MTDFNDPRIAVIETTPMWAGDLSIQVVDEALKAEGLDDKLLPAQPSRSICMRRAFQECAPRGARIDPLPAGMGVAMSLKDVNMLDLEALAAQQGHEVREAASYTAKLTAKILVENINGTEIETLTFTPHDHPMVALVREVYKTKRDQYKASEDLSVWFSQTIIPAVGGVGKRSRGGVYYVPAARKDTLMKVASALSKLSQSSAINREVAGVNIPVYQLTHGGKLCMEPRYADDSAAMEILIDGVIRDTDSVIDGLAESLEVKEGKKALGKRGLATKKREAANLEAQLASWEQVCSVSLDLLRNRLTEVQDAIGTAELVCELEEVADKD